MTAGRRAFGRIAAAGVLFQGGAATTDTSTIVAALVYGLTGSPVAVGAAAAISRIGWLLPQIIVAHVAQGRTRRMPLYAFGAFGRALCLLGVVALLLAAEAIPNALVVPLFFLLWTLFAFVSGVVAVPYNDIVGRAVPSERRSRLLALRFFGGGLLALAVAAAAQRLLGTLAFPGGHAGVLALGALLMLASAASFVSAGEAEAPKPEPARGFAAFLRGGIEVLRSDRRFRLFLGAQWCGGAVAMALPFYVLEATRGGALGLGDVAYLVAAQTTGALLSNPLWGWLGDRRGKLVLLRAVAALGALAPALTLAWLAFGASAPAPALAWFVLIFVVNGAVDNGRTIGYLGYLMEISPDHRRPAYSGYFNALVAPVWLLPIAAAALAEFTTFAVVFASSLLAAGAQVLVLRRLADGPAAA